MDLPLPISWLQVRLKFTSEVSIGYSFCPAFIVVIGQSVAWPKITSVSS